jgi:hypothetical protein
MECVFQLIKGMRQLESQDKDWKEKLIPIILDQWVSKR